MVGGAGSGLGVDLTVTGLAACLRAVLCEGIFWLALLAGDGMTVPPGTRPGASVAPLEREGVSLLGAGPLALAVGSLPFGREEVGLVIAGEADLEPGAGLRDCGDAVGVTTAALEAVLARLAASRRRREAGEPGRRCARRERWPTPGGGLASLRAGARAGVVVGPGSAEAVVGEVQGLDGLGHLEDGSGQTGLLGWEAAPRKCGLVLSLEEGFGLMGGL